MPSYASEAFLIESEKWLTLVGAELAPLRHPEGPIVLCQIDNEGTLYFRDGLYDQDYRPEAIVLYQAFLREKNPWALMGIVRRLFEAAQRGMWEQPPEDVVGELRRLAWELDAYLEGWRERRRDEGRAS